MERRFIFRGGEREVILPVTPESYQVEKGNNIEIVNIHELGDVSLVGYGTLASIKIDCMLPARDYSFGLDNSAEEYVRIFKGFVSGREELRFIISGAGVNIPVYLQDFQYGEKDGTNDIYASLTLRERKQLQAAVTAAPAENKQREAEPEKGNRVESYLVKYGDTLCAICRSYYGNDSPDTYYRLTSYNGNSNPNILYAGETIRIPTPLPYLKSITSAPRINGSSTTAKLMRLKYPNLQLT